MWVIIQEDTIYHEGDERSRTNPGHGYPAHTEKVSKATSYTNYEKFVEAVERLETGYSMPKYQAYKAEPITVTKKIVIDIN